MAPGSVTGGGTWHRPADNQRAVLNGMLTVLIDPVRLGTQDAFEQEAAAFVAWLRESPPAPGSQGVLLAGEPERQARVLRERDGIEIDEATWQEIQESARKVGAKI